MPASIKIAAKVKKGTSSKATLKRQATKGSSGTRPIARTRAQVFVRIQSSPSGQPRRKR